MKKFEIWAFFPDGVVAKVESHKSRRSAQSAIGAMDNANRREAAEGYGFPHGAPSYVIKEV